MNEAEDEKTKKAVWSPGTGFYHAQRPVDIFIKPVECLVEPRTLRFEFIVLPHLAPIHPAIYLAPLRTSIC